MGKKVNVLFAEGEKIGGKVGRLMRVLVRRVPVTTERSGRCPRGQGVHALGMSKQFGAEAILWLAGGSSVVELCNCAL